MYMYTKSCCTLFSSVQSLSCVQFFATPWTAACHASLSFTVSQSLLKLMSIESVMPSNCLVLCHPLLLFSVFPSIRVFSNKSTFHIRWLKYWSFSLSISPSNEYNEYSRLISFRVDWFDLCIPRDSQESSLTPQSKSINSSALSLSMVQLLHLYMTTGKTSSLTIQTFVGKVIPLILNMLSRFVIPFLPRSKRLLFSWLQSLSTVILESKKVKSVTVSIFSPSICHEMMGPDAMIFIF